MKGGHMVNKVKYIKKKDKIILNNFKQRAKNNLPSLDLINARIVFYRGDETIENKISSTKIRKGIKNDASFMKESFEKWNNLTNHLQINNTDSYYWFSILRDFYSQFWRKYHTLNHIFNFIENFDEYVINNFNENNKNFIEEEKLNFYLAIWFHDVIYVPSRKDNEEVSIKVIKN